MKNILICFSDEEEEYYVLCENAGPRIAVDVESICMIIDSNHDLKKSANLIVFTCTLFNMLGGIQYKLVERGRASEYLNRSSVFINTTYSNDQSKWIIEISCPCELSEKLIHIKENLKNKTQVNMSQY